MIGLTLSAFVTIAIVIIVLIRFPRRLRPLVVRSLACAVTVGSVAIVGYTLDNEVYHQQNDIGDANYYINEALNYLHSGETKAFYPVYIKFLAAFLLYGSPALARFGQLAVFILVYLLLTYGLYKAGTSRSGIAYFSLFTVANGMFYGLATQLVRDILIGAVIMLFTPIVVLLQTATTGGPTKKIHFLLLGPAGVGLAQLGRSLQPWLPYLLAASLAAELISAAIRRPSKSKGRRLISLVVYLTIFLVPVIVLAGVYDLNYALRLYEINVVEGALDKYSPAPRDALSIFRSVLGPGLIRPLFPALYFGTWVPTHLLFYWWGTLFWYINLVFSLPLVLGEPLRFWGRPGATFSFCMFMSYLLVYVATYGSGLGLRKRAILHLLYTSFVAYSYFPEAETAACVRPRSTTAATIRFAMGCLIVLANVLSLWESE